VDWLEDRRLPSGLGIPSVADRPAFNLLGPVAVGQLILATSSGLTRTGAAGDATPVALGTVSEIENVLGPGVTKNLLPSTRLETGPITGLTQGLRSAISPGIKISFAANGPSGIGLKADLAAAPRPPSVGHPPVVTIGTSSAEDGGAGTLELPGLSIGVHLGSEAAGAGLGTTGAPNEIDLAAGGVTVNSGGSPGALVHLADLPGRITGVANSPGDDSGPSHAPGGMPDVSGSTVPALFAGGSNLDRTQPLPPAGAGSVAIVGRTTSDPGLAIRVNRIPSSGNGPSQIVIAPGDDAAPLMPIADRNNPEPTPVDPATATAEAPQTLSRAADASQDGTRPGPQESTPQVHGETEPIVAAETARGVSEYPAGSDEALSPSKPEMPAELTPSDLEALGQALWHFLEGLEGAGDELSAWLSDADVLAALLGAGAVTLACKMIRRRLRRSGSDLEQAGSGVDGANWLRDLPGPLYLARG
jgi:hypothetical protein